jgi:hypothetical protein
MGGMKKMTAPLIILLGQKVEQRRFTDLPIIIGACPRSGTTILLSILGAHPNIFAIPKQTYAFDCWQSVQDKKRGGMQWRPTRLDRLYLQFLIHHIPGNAKRWLEKTPKHIRSFEKILAYYNEQVKLINIIRDGRAVITSRHPKHNPDNYWVSVQRWISDVKTGLSLDSHPNMLNIKYEGLINDFEKTMENVFRFLGENKPDNLHDWTQKTNIKRSMHLAEPVQNIYSHALDRWRKPEHADRIKEFMNNREAVDLLKKLGYPE